ncbi:MAG: argininosuccinate lyase [Candidatus Schekmanbacteria bacterium]|nr:argininosuccinate lyase [Candidatus Schekmanbacteria bacterium]
MKMKKLWGGRFEAATDRIVDEFTASIDFDKRLYRHDIEGNIAHCKMLQKVGIISASECRKITSTLKEIENEIASGKAKFTPEVEDIHMYIEGKLIEKAGETGKKLHTGRSRNDQVALDTRMYLKDEIKEIFTLLKQFISEIAAAAEKQIDVVMPGYTHMQHAQSVLLSHHLHAYTEMLLRDIGRLKQCYKSADVMPLGAGALAGSSFPLDREYVAKLLGFSSVTANSMDTVSDRDYQLEFIFFSSLLFMHLSRMCEELILWNGTEFSFVELPDEFTTGSSMMPQKKNPDVLELVRGKTGRVYGSLISVLTLLKAQPLTYNRDMQEDKEALFDTADTVKKSLLVLGKFFGKIKFNRARLEYEAGEGFMEATDLADYLVMKLVPFRQAHEVSGKIVIYCLNKKKKLRDLSMNELMSFHKGFCEDVLGILDPKSSVKRKKTSGSTSPAEVKKNIKRLYGILGKLKLS